MQFVANLLKKPRMYPLVSTKDPEAVERELEAASALMFPEVDPVFVRRAFDWVADSFHGRYEGYQAIDAKYHDFKHTLDATLCLARLLAERHLAGANPILARRHFELALLAILLHDSGYLKKQEDRAGTGAKYTAVHVDRSTQFAARLMAAHGYSTDAIAAVGHMICCTSMAADLFLIPFLDAAEQVAGFAVGTADLLGQMAADDYVDKLPLLYLEFVEAQQFNGGGPAATLFPDAEELIRQTPVFWRQYVLPKIENQFAGLYRFLSHPYPDGPNVYLDRIQLNLKRIEREFGRKE